MGIGKGSLSGTTSNFSRRNTSTHTSTKPPTGWTSIEDLGRHCERLDRRAGSESRYYYNLRNPVCPKYVPEKLKQPPTPKREMGEIKVAVEFGSEQLISREVRESGSSVGENTNDDLGGFHKQHSLKWPNRVLFRDW